MAAVVVVIIISHPDQIHMHYHHALSNLSYQIRSELGSDPDVAGSNPVVGYKRNFSSFGMAQWLGLQIAKLMGPRLRGRVFDPV